MSFFFLDVCRFWLSSKTVTNCCSGRLKALPITIFDHEKTHSVAAFIANFGGLVLRFLHRQMRGVRWRKSTNDRKD
jgi:hypothetical protein